MLADMESLRLSTRGDLSPGQLHRGGDAQSRSDQRRVARIIAAYTSWTNDFQFCWRWHAAGAAEMLGSEELVRSVLNDLEFSALPEPEKALMGFEAR